MPGCRREMTRESHRPNSACGDHDHQTGRPRALLCLSCNVSFGRYEKYREVGAQYEQRFTVADPAMLAWGLRTASGV